MIKKLLLAGAFALTMLSASYAQVDKVVDSSYYTTGDVQVVGTDGTNYGAPTLDGSNNVTIAANVSAGNYSSFTYSVGNLVAGTFTASTFPFPNQRPRTVKVSIAANPATTIRVSLTDNNNFTTDAVLPASAFISATPTLTTYTITYVSADFVQEYSGSCSPSAPCKVDSFNISQIQFYAGVTPSASSAYSGTISIGYIYAGDSVNPSATPIVSLTSPNQNTTIVENTAFTLSANATSTTGIDSVSFWDGTAFIGKVTSAPYNFNWPSVSAGVHTITAVAYSGTVGTTSTSYTITANPAPTITGLMTVGASGYTHATDSGFYSRGDASIFGGVGTADYATPVQDANGNLVINVTKGADYNPITIALPGPTHLPKHAMQATISIAASAAVSIRYVIQDGNNYITDQVSTPNVDVASGPVDYTQTLITIPFNTSGALNDLYSNCSTGPSTPCVVDTSNIVALQILPTAGNIAYNGTIVIGYVYVGDTSTTKITGVTSAAAAAATSLYPNPATATANYNVAVSGDITATLSDMTGKVVATQNGTSGSFDVSGLNKGVYVVSFARNGAYYSSQKLVVSGN